MLRRITACAVLLALFSAYLTPLAANAAPAAKPKKNAKPAFKLAPEFETAGDAADLVRVIARLEAESSTGASTEPSPPSE